MLPQLGHAVIGGEALQLSVVELSTMAVRCVLTDCQDWSIALCACTSAEGKVRLLSLEASGDLRSWEIAISQGSGVEASPRGAVRARGLTLPLP